MIRVDAGRGNQVRTRHQWVYFERLINQTRGLGSKFASITLEYRVHHVESWVTLKISMVQPDQPARDASPKPATAGSWKPGQSGNPKGRPRSGLAFAERVRERIDPDLIIDLAVRVAADETLSPKTRLEALWPLIDRGFIKPPTTIAAQVQTTTTTRDWSAVPLEERRALLAQLRGVRPALEHRVSDPKVLDGGAALLPIAVAHAVAKADEE